MVLAAVALGLMTAGASPVAVVGETEYETLDAAVAAPFVEFMLDVILRTIKAKGVPKSALGISRSAIQKHIEHLKDAQRLRRIGPDKGGRWSVCASLP